MVFTDQLSLLSRNLRGIIEVKRGAP